jgi:hypothetical protein
LAMMMNGRVGTRTEDLLTYISNETDVLDRNDMTRHFLVNGQCSYTHSSQSTGASRESRLLLFVSSFTFSFLESHWRTLVKSKGWCKAKFLNCWRSNE